ncbi:MAG: U32 family peptidase, partial [Lachnospiraceae bacterium]|nr:U32 family peptidase [Lachnospiraceae bacterium]
LEEIRDIKKNVNIEIEAFVHGAECYSYSGACLLSSIIGGRSGNRGRCAQPCRLPYHVLQDHKKVTPEEQYVLSLKDMCTLELLPALIDAGIDSFKIEGRMKKPEYAAGVTAIYRKYIDLYEKDPQHYKVTREDLSMIRKLYIRSEIQDGYYRKHNGKEMVTLSKPSYSGSDEALLTRLRSEYIETTKKLAVKLHLTLHSGQAMECEITHENTGTTVSVKGDMVQKATSRPVERESVVKQISKTGNTNYRISDLTIDMDSDIFIPLKSMNIIRREGLQLLEQTLLGVPRKSVEEPIKDVKEDSGEKENPPRASHVTRLDTVIHTMEQLTHVLSFPSIDRIFVSSDLLYRNGIEGLQDSFREIREMIQSHHKRFYFVLPYIIRERSYAYLESIRCYITEPAVEGVLIRNLESLQWLKEISYQKSDGKDVILDAEIYCFNTKAKEFLLEKENATELTASYELNLKELLRMGLKHMNIPVYGRIPMMITANCIRKTTLQCANTISCNHQYDLLLEDRYQKNFYVNTNCLHCYNVIYNGQPTSLHGYLDKFLRYHVKAMRLDFTTEQGMEIDAVVHFFENAIQHPEEKMTPPYTEFTKGHLARGVE